MSESVDEAEAREGRGDLILIADASVDGEAIASALRARSFWVADVPLALLESRALADGPRAIVIDVAQEGAPLAAEHVRAALVGKPLDIFCVGDASRAQELGATKAARRAFERPLDVGALVDAIAEIARPMESTRGTTPPPSYIPRPETARPPQRESEAPASGFPGPDAELGGILPGLDEEGAGGLAFGSIEVSPELAQVLEAAEQRVAATSGPQSSTAVEEEIDMILGPELLQALDEPIDAEDDDHRTGSEFVPGSGTPAPRGRTASATGTATGTVSVTGTIATAAPSMSSAPSSRAALTPTPSRSVTELDDAAFSSRRGVMLGQSADFTWEAAARTPPPIDASARTPMSAERSHRAPPSVAFGETATSDDERPRTLREADDRGRAPRVATSSPSDATLRDPVDARAQVRAPSRTIEIFEPPMSEDSARRFAAGPPTMPRGEEPKLPTVLREGDAVIALAHAVAHRMSGALALGTDAATRRVVLHDGDVVTAGSGVPEESLVGFLVARGDLERGEGSRLAGRLPPFGRHAGAALVANGHLSQDELWPVLRAHAEWVIARALASDQGSCELEPEPPGRLRAEPNVFGGATGAEVFVEAVRRVFTPDVAMHRLGGPSTRLDDGPRSSLLAECALSRHEDEIARTARGRTVGEITANDPEIANVLYALVSLDVLDAIRPVAPAADDKKSEFDPLDEEALRMRVRARCALVEEGDYFALLGIPRSATSYEIKRAYLELRRAFDPRRVLTASTADLADQLDLVVEVLDEAYAILREPHRRERYRRAIEAGPP